MECQTVVEPCSLMFSADEFYRLRDVVESTSSAYELFVELVNCDCVYRVRCIVRVLMNTFL